MLGFLFGVMFRFCRASVVFVLGLCFVSLRLLLSLCSTSVRVFCQVSVGCWVYVGFMFGFCLVLLGFPKDEITSRT